MREKSPMEHFEDQCRNTAEALMLAGKYVPPGFDRNRVVSIEIAFMVGDERRTRTFFVPDQPALSK